MTKNKKIGRPKLAKGVGKSSIITLRLSSQEKQSIAAEANKCGISPSEWIKNEHLQKLRTSERN